MARKLSPDRLLSTNALIEDLKKLTGKMTPEDLALHERLVQLASQDPRALVDGVVGLDAVQRKAYLAPHLDFHKALKKVHNPDSRVYRAPPAGTFRTIARTLEGLLGWMKSRHKYKPDELRAPARDEALLALQDHFREATGDKEFFLPGPLVDSMRVCDGVHPRVRMHADTGLRFFSVDEIRDHHAKMVDAFGHPERVPVSDDGAGNYFVLIKGEVYDLNHEDGEVVPLARGLYSLLGKSHKPKRF